MENKEKYTPSHIANYFLCRSWRERIGITTIKLIKLVYIAYGWNLVFNKERRRLFEEPILAWRQGIFIPSIYHEFKIFGDDPIDDNYYSLNYEVDMEDRGQITYPQIEDNDLVVLKILGAVWKTYKDKSGLELSNITHQPNGAWYKAYGKGINSALEDKDIANEQQVIIDLIYNQIINNK